MITKFTPEQKALFSVIQDKWISYTLNTTPIDHQKAEEAVRKLYIHMGFSSPKFIYVPDPTKIDEILVEKRKISSRIRNRISYKISDQVFDQIWNRIRNRISDKIYNQISDQIWNQILDQIRNRIWDQIPSQIRYQIWNQIRLMADLAFIDFFKQAFHMDFPLLDRLEEIYKHLPFFLFLDNVAILIENPVRVSTENNVLHADGRKAIEYPSGWGFCYLHGVRVPDWLSLTKDTDIDPSRIHEIINAEIRREFVRKVGLERILYKLKGELLDRKIVVLATPDNPTWNCTYELYELQFRDSKRRVLKMDNPSLPDTCHVEYVPNRTGNVHEAMNFRLNREETDVDDIHGSDWYLHGDVVIKPKDMKKWKRWPKVIA